jgi:hypothetical protein
MERRRRVYRGSISKDVGVIEAIDECLMEVREEEERQWLEWLRTACVLPLAGMRVFSA